MPDIEPGPDQESVWDYPRPPRVEPTTRRVRVMFARHCIADSSRSLRVLETSHPPVYYIPRADVTGEHLEPCDRVTFCEFKGRAVYWTVRVGAAVATEAAWSYPNPSPGYELIRDHLAFYPGAMDECTVDGEVVQPQPGNFYGGWVTAEVVGPFKGGPGSSGW